MKAIFDLVGRPESPVNYRATNSFHVTQLKSRLEHDEALQLLVDDYVAEMCNDGIRFLKKSEEMGGNLYVVSEGLRTFCSGHLLFVDPSLHHPDIAGIVATLKQRVVESMIYDRYGLVSSRIFRLLLDQKFLDQKQVAQLAMIPSDHARERLYRMMSDGITSIQEVPKSSDRLVLRTIFLWFVNYPQVLKTVQENSLKMMANLRSRYTRELDLSEKLIEKATAINNGEGGGLTKSEETQLQTLQQTLHQLENGQNHLLETIVLLQFV